jgi:ABC-type nitrate/sulfonate/bicarbonate transport system substrate-binding protein
MPFINRKPLKLGFVPLIDCAPLVVAKEFGLFEKYHLDVQLRRELGWATIRDKILYGELDAAHALAVMPFVASLGVGSLRSECISALVLNLHGNAITLSNELKQRGVRDARSLRFEIERNRGQRTYTFGVVFSWSSHNFLLRQWLVSGGIDPDRDVRIVIVPPTAVLINLKAGNLDGYCVGEPWNSLAVADEIGWCPVTSSQLASGHPEKVLMVRADWEEAHHDEHLRLAAALMEACSFCENLSNREQVAQILAQPAYLNTDAAILRRSLIGPFAFSSSRVEPMADFHRFAGGDANEPAADKARWILDNLLRLGAIPERSAVRTAATGSVFRMDLYEQARQLMHEHSPTTLPTPKALELTPA